MKNSPTRVYVVANEAKEVGFKKCSNCFQLKNFSEFYPRRKGNNSYVQSRCKNCNSEVVRESKKRRFQKEFSAWVKDSSARAYVVARGEK